MYTLAIACCLLAYIVIVFLVSVPVKLIPLRVTREIFTGKGASVTGRAHRMENMEAVGHSLEGYKYIYIYIYIYTYM